MNVVASFTSRSLRIRRQRGPRSNYEEPSRGTTPRFLLRDRDRISGHEFVQQLEAMDVKEVLSPPRSPWQRAYVERMIGTIRRECLDHILSSTKIVCAGISNRSPTNIIGAARI
jgi:transposase InsO family protein